MAVHKNKNEYNKFERLKKCGESVGVSTSTRLFKVTDPAYALYFSHRYSSSLHQSDQAGSFKKQSGIFSSFRGTGEFKVYVYSLE